MIFIKYILNSLLALALFSGFFIATASASLILDQYDSNTPIPDTIGGYVMTDFDVMNDTMSGDTSTVVSPLGGLLTFTDVNGAILDLTRGLADSTDWWINGENSDYDIFTTEVNWVTILLPENTRALSFNVGANKSAGGWMTATETDGNGIDTKYDFGLSPTNTPGFAIYTNNSSGQCSALTSITIDPIKWGVGNFSINNDRCNTVSIPEPVSIALFGLGFMGLLLSRRESMNRAAGSV